jgi:hypothetical protein
LCHTSALVRVKVDVVYVQGGRDKGLGVGGGCLLVASACRKSVLYSPEALINRAKLNVDLYLVVLESNKRKSKARIVAEPELKRNVEGGLRKSVTRSAYLSRCAGIAWTINVRELRISQESELGGLADHLVVATLLILVHGKLRPDVHPVTVLLVNALTTNLYLNTINELMAREIQPSGIEDTVSTAHGLVDLRKSYLEVSAVGKITISGDRAGYSASKVALAIESLLNGLHREVCVSAVSNLPVSNLGISSKIYILCAISY